MKAFYLLAGMAAMILIAVAGALWIVAAVSH